MRTEKEIYDLVLNFAFQDERIRIVTLEGSRTNVNIPKDNLQDYDITFFVIDMGEFLKSDDWLSVFGNRIMMQKPEDMELFPPEEKGFAESSPPVGQNRIDLIATRQNIHFKCPTLRIRHPPLPTHAEGKAELPVSHRHFREKRQSAFQSEPSHHFRTYPAG